MAQTITIKAKMGHTFMALSLYKVEVGYSSENQPNQGLIQKTILLSSGLDMPWKQLSHVLIEILNLIEKSWTLHNLHREALGSSQSHEDMPERFQMRPQKALKLCDFVWDSAYFAFHFVKKHNQTKSTSSEIIWVWIEQLVLYPFVHPNSIGGTSW